MLPFYLSMLETDDDKSKFERLYKEYRRLMLHVANEYLHDSLLAEDCVHNAFVYVAINIYKVGDIKDTQTKSYLLTITRANAINMFNRHCRESNIFDYENDGSGQSGDSLEDEFFESQDKQWLTEKIKELPEELREPIIMRYGLGLEYMQIAKNMGISPAAARKRVQRAKERLRSEALKNNE